MLHDAGFRRFWAAQVVSEAGFGVGALALPLTAVLTLDASALDMDVLAAAATLPVLLLALPSGVWVAMGSPIVGGTPRWQSRPSLRSSMAYKACGEARTCALAISARERGRAIAHFDHSFRHCSI